MRRALRLLLLLAACDHQNCGSNDAARYGALVDPDMACACGRPSMNEDGSCLVDHGPIFCGCESGREARSRSEARRSP